MIWNTYSLSMTWTHSQFQTIPELSIFSDGLNSTLNYYALQITILFKLTRKEYCMKWLEYCATNPDLANLLKQLHATILCTYMKTPFEEMQMWYPSEYTSVKERSLMLSHFCTHALLLWNLLSLRIQLAKWEWHISCYMSSSNKYKVVCSLTESIFVSVLSFL